MWASVPISLSNCWSVYDIVVSVQVSFHTEETEPIRSPFLRSKRIKSILGFFFVQKRVAQGHQRQNIHQFSYFQGASSWFLFLNGLWSHRSQDYTTISLIIVRVGFCTKWTSIFWTRLHKGILNVAESLIQRSCSA